MKTTCSNKPDELMLKKAQSLVELCEKHDKASPRVQFDHSFNMHKDMTDWFFVFDEDNLIGLASIFAPADNEAEISICVNPLHRNQGVFKTLFSCAQREIQSYGIKKILLVVDQLAIQGQDLVRKRNLKIDHSEYSMELPADVPVITDGKVILREALETDIPELIAIAMKTFDYSKESAESMIRAGINNPSRLQYVCLNENTIVGQCALGIKKNRISINGVGIIPEKRGLGLGRSLMLELITLIDRKNNLVKLEVFSKNDRAKSLYESLGFKTVSAMDYYIA